jgi:AmiR/NasT family two-component response regulator
MVDPEVQARAVNGFAEAQRAQNQLVTLAYRVSDNMGRLTPVHRFTLCQYARSIYAVHRREAPELLEMTVAGIVGKYVLRGLDRETVLAVLKACWMQLTGRTCPAGLVVEAGRVADALTAAASSRREHE